jgi:ADP-ribosyl-[dinitrogen reductase] hydrolase
MTASPVTDHAPPLGGPLHIDSIRPGGATSALGVIGMTHCPGRNGRDGRGRVWQRSLALDAAVISQAGFDTVLSLLDDAELAALGAAGLHQQLRSVGVDTLQFPIHDFGVPGADALPVWRAVQAEVLIRLHAGRNVLVHCAAGLGRTGTVVALLLKALGEPAEVAIEQVRKVRPGTVETDAQAAFVRAFGP